MNWTTPPRPWRPTNRPGTVATTFLFVTTEGFWGYALWGWLAGAPGPRSRRFAMTSAIVMFLLSFIGQEAAHLVASGRHTAPWYVVVIVTPLPLIAVGLIALLIHLRQADREEAMAAWRKAKAAEEAAKTARAEADERTSLRRQIGELSARLDTAAIAHRAELDEAVSDVGSARQELTQALKRTEALERKLAAVDTPKSRKPTAAGTGRNAKAPAGGDDLTMEFQAYMALRDDPALRKPRMGGKLATQIGCSPASARRYRDRFLNPDGSLKELPRESLTGSLGESLTDGTP
jgi:hypothetical protein